MRLQSASRASINSWPQGPEYNFILPSQTGKHRKSKKVQRDNNYAGSYSVCRKIDIWNDLQGSQHVHLGHLRDQPKARGRHPSGTSQSS